MSSEQVKLFLLELARAASDLAAICAREDMDQFAPFFRAASESATRLAIDPLDRVEVNALVRDVSSIFSYQSGGFMDHYVVRQDPAKQLEENLAFEKAQRRVLDAAANVKTKADEGQVDLLRARRELVTIETLLLEAGLSDEAANVRKILNGSEIDPGAAIELANTLLASAQPSLAISLRPRVHDLANALRPPLA